nr:MAG TPA: hypothetical protein [Caudoviricetes sp.]
MIYLHFRRSIKRTFMISARRISAQRAFSGLSVKYTKMVRTSLIS